MKIRIIEKNTVINSPLKEVFEFFSKAENLNLLTPVDLHFRIITPLPIMMEKGAFIEYILQLYGIPLKWKTEITAWDPPYYFEDSQKNGPYKQWIHQHSFTEVNGNTHMHDKVLYASPGWFLEPIVHLLFVRNNLKTIFDFREKAIKKIFEK